MSYRIEQGNHFIGIRTIDKKSFLLIIDNLIDRENLTNTEEKFILIIYDHGIPSKQIRLEYQINIIDENDSPPLFNQSYNCNIQINYSENQTLGLFKLSKFSFLNSSIKNIQAKMELIERLIEGERSHTGTFLQLSRFESFVKL